MASRSTFVVTWNPAKWQWPDGEYPAAVAATERGKTYDRKWSTGTRTHGVAVGDRIFMLLQGSGPKGVIGSGAVTEPIHADKHWDEHRSRFGFAPFVMVRWDTMLRQRGVLPRNLLVQRLPAGNRWAPQGGGWKLPNDLAEELEALWAEHRASGPPPCPRSGVAPGPGRVRRK